MLYLLILKNLCLIKWLNLNINETDINLRKFNLPNAKY